jgi:quercetin dioxygenase-like cupin family protein
MLNVIRPRSSFGLAASLALALLLAAVAAPAETPAQDSLAAESHSGARTVLSTGSTVTDQPIHYPTGAPAHVTAVEITLAPGQQTGWHMHPVPMFGYILDGELTVDYGPKGQRVYRKGDGLMEAVDEPHNGRNLGTEPVKILAVVIGADGIAGSVPASPPPR